MKKTYKKIGKFKELDVVTLTKDFPEHGIKKGRRNMKKKKIELNNGENMTGEYLDYQWAIIRQDMGHLCGYVRLFDNHPFEYLFKKKYCYNDIDINCHGGLTFAEKLTKKNIIKGFKPGYWIGWDYAHAFDEIIINKPSYKSIIPSKHWTEDEVIKECYDVIEQLMNKYPRLPTNESKNTVKLTKAKPEGYFLEVFDDLSSNRWAITKNELLLIWKVVKDEVEKIFKEQN